MKLPGYTQKLLDAVKDVQLTPGLHIAHIMHDDWCALLAGTGPCNCNPEVRIPGLPGRN